MNIFKFEDFITKYNNIQNDEWITLFEQNKSSSNGISHDIYTFSVLIQNKDNLINETLSKFTWEFSVNDFGKSYFGKSITYHKNKEESIYFEPGNISGIYEYLFAIRTFNNKYDDIIEINPKLIWYKNLYKNNDYYIDPINDEKIIHITKDIIEIKKTYLKDFLSAYNQCCVINFDHRRYYKSDSDISFNSKIINNDLFKAEIVENNYDYDNFDVCCSMLGKVIIEPYLKPHHNDFVEFSEEKQYESFIIGTDSKTGDLISFTCDETKLGNLFGANPNSPQFLTPIYFDKKVLNNYTSDTENYTVRDSLIVHLDKWSLPFTINEENKVIVWLGDLGRIPFNEQKIWKAYNIHPDGKVEENFLKRQLYCEWTDSSLGEKGLFDKLNKINEFFNIKYNESIFNDLSLADKDLESSLLIPATNSIPVYQSFLMQLSKITVERINTKLIGKLVSHDKLLNDDNKKLGSRIQLNLFLKQIGIQNADKLDDIFKIIYNSRNKLSGHSGSIEEYNKVWNRDKKYKPNYISDAKNIITSLNNVLNDIIEELN